MTAQQLKNSILQMAVQGKLVSQDPNDEPASVLLERIRAEKERLIKEKKIKKDKNPSFIFRGADNIPYEKVGDNEPVSIADEVPFEIPESWEWVRFKDLVDYSMGKTPPRKETEYWTNPTYPWVSIADLVADGIVTTTKEKVNEYASRTIFKGQISKTGTLLMSFKLTVGKVSILDIDAFHNEAIISIYPFIDYEQIITNFLFATLPLLSQNGDTKTAIKGNTLNSDSLDAMLIPIPPINEQKRIVSKIKILLPLIEEYDKKEKQLTNLNTAFPDSLKKSILQQAVQGKLVPQDPSDEPASVLLERIQKEKQRLIKEDKIKKDKQESIIYRRDNSHYERCDGVERCIDEEIPFEIPESWEWVRFGNLFAINPRNSLPDDILVGFMPMSFLQEGFENRHTFVTKLWKEVKSGFTHLADNDIVIAKITPCFQNRKSAIIRNFPNGYGAGTTELHVLRDFTNILYMPYFLLICKSQMFIQEGIKNFTGTAGQQRVGRDFIFNYTIPIPPITEQHRIVAKVEELLSRVEQL